MTTQNRIHLHLEVIKSDHMIKLPTVRRFDSTHKLEYLFDKIKFLLSQRIVMKNLPAGSFLFTIQIILLNKRLIYETWQRWRNMLMYNIIHISLLLPLLLIISLSCMFTLHGCTLELIKEKCNWNRFPSQMQFYECTLILMGKVETSWVPFDLFHFAVPTVVFTCNDSYYSFSF